MITMSDEEQKGLTGFFSRFGSAKKQTVSEEEIKDIVADNDELADDEKRMIHDIIDLGDMSVHEIMQPRVDMIMVEDTETVRTAVERMHGTGYSRLPIFHEDADHIIGIVHYRTSLGRSSTAVRTTLPRSTLSSPCSSPRPRTSSRCSRKCKRIGNRWPSWWTNTVGPMV